MRALAAAACLLCAGCFEAWNLDGLLYACGKDGTCPNSLTCDDGVCCRPGDQPVCPTLVPASGVCPDGSAPKTYYADKDGDGYGDPNTARLACHKPVSTPYVENNTDCDDTSASSHPGGIEVCDGHDNNCDGKIDNGQMPLTTYYRDEDGDGYGDDNDTIMACDCLAIGMPPCVPPGYSDQGGDCAPMDATRFPHAKERCNGLDDDCNGAIDDPPVLYVGDPCNDAGIGLCAAGTKVCTAGMLVCNSTYVPTLDVCDGQDNDCDGLTDEQPDCGGPVSLTGTDVNNGAQFLNTLSFTMQTASCLKDHSPFTTQTWVDPAWTGSGSGFHVWWAEAPGNTTWDLSRGPKLLLDFKWRTVGGAPVQWDSLKQPVVYVCNADGTHMNRYVHIPGTLLTDPSMVEMGAVSSVVDFSALSDNDWNVGSSVGLDATKVKRIELLVQVSTATSPTFTITFFPDAGFTP
jgi:hypothetical protein